MSEPDFEHETKWVEFFDNEILLMIPELDMYNKLFEEDFKSNL